MKPTLKVEYREQVFNEENNSLEETYKDCKCEISWEDYLKNKWGWMILSVLFTLISISLFIISTIFWSEEEMFITGIAVFVSSFFTLFYMLNVLDKYEYIDMWGICARRELSKYEQFLIDKYFPKLEAEFVTNSITAKLKAEQWRAAHPLEEKCRLAMTKNPNYVADLIKYIKEHNDDHNDICPYCGSKDTVVQTAKHYDLRSMTTEERHRIKCCNCGKVLSQDYEEHNNDR